MNWMLTVSADLSNKQFEVIGRENVHWVHGSLAGGCTDWASYTMEQTGRQFWFSGVLSCLLEMGLKWGNPLDPLGFSIYHDPFVVHHQTGTVSPLQLHLHLILIDMALSLLITILRDHDQLNICKLTSKYPVWTGNISFPEISRTSWTAGLLISRTPIWNLLTDLTLQCLLQCSRRSAPGPKSPKAYSIEMCGTMSEIRSQQTVITCLVSWRHWCCSSEHVRPESATWVNLLDLLVRASRLDQKHQGLHPWSQERWCWERGITDGPSFRL